MVEIILKVSITTMLVLCSAQDMYKKKLLVWPLVLFALLVILCSCFSNSISILDRLGGFILGLGVILLSLVTGGKIGLGDGIILAITGIGLGLWANMELFAIALFLAAIVSILLLILRIANRKKSIPFVPFLLVSYLFMIVIRIKSGTP